MKTPISLLALLLATATVNAQNFLAGDPLTIFADIDPDTLINYSPCNPSLGTPVVLESFSFDMDGDMQDDFMLKASCNWSPPPLRYVSLVPLHGEASARFVWSDSVYTVNEFYAKVKMAEQLAVGELINAALAQWMNEQLYFSYYIQDYYTLNVSNWALSSDRYVGVRLGTGNTFRYGWIRLNCTSASECILKDYALGEEVIESTTGLHNTKAMAFNAYMDYASNMAVIDITAATETTLRASVYDLVGRNTGISETLHVKAAIKHRLDVSALSAGQYFIAFTDGNATLGTVRIQKVN